MTAEESNALVELLAEKVQGRIDDIRAELYESVDQALAQVLRQFFRPDAGDPAGAGSDNGHPRGEPVDSVC